MFKKALSFFTVFFVLFSSQALAHTSLIDSTPKDGALVSESLEEMTLYFGTKVEERSTMTISRADGQAVSLQQLAVNGDEMTATFLQPLFNGEYAVKWNIIGADGHPMEGQLTFTVNVSANEQGTEEETVVSPSEQTPIVEQSKQASVEESTELNEWPPYVIPTIISILGVIAIGSMVMIMKRKRRQ